MRLNTPQAREKLRFMSIVGGVDNHTAETIFITAANKGEIVNAAVDHTGKVLIAVEIEGAYELFTYDPADFVNFDDPPFIVHTASFPDSLAGLQDMRAAMATFTITLGDKSERTIAAMTGIV